MCREEWGVYLGLRALACAAEPAAARVGVRMPDITELAGLYAERYPLPIERNGLYGRAWFDRYYIAYQCKGGALRYLYIAPMHIYEELVGWRNAEMRGAGGMPYDVRRELRKAERVIGSGETLYVAEEAKDALRRAGLRAEEWQETEREGDDFVEIKISATGGRELSVKDV